MSVKRELLDTVKARKLAYYGHTMRKQGSCLEKEIMQGTMPGARRQGKPRMAWMDNIKTSGSGSGQVETWTGLSVEESIRMTEDRDKWRKYVHDVADPLIEDVEQNIGGLHQQCMNQTENVTSPQHKFSIKCVGSPHSRPACRAVAAVIDQYLLPAPDLSSKPTGSRCCCRSMGQTDRRTDTRPFYSAYCTLCELCSNSGYN